MDITRVLLLVRKGRHAGPRFRCLVRNGDVGIDRRVQNGIIGNGRRELSN
jgi:hypothetical protein